jgi:pyruvate dehydrogenase E1 component beta subunit
MIQQINHSFVQYINSRIKVRFGEGKNVVFGQNIVAGSRISGLGSGLDELDSIVAINTPNVENSLMGFGLGMMLSGTDSIFLMKQHDFALLGLDQLTNTVNVVRTLDLSSSFIVMMVVVDSGYEGPQSSLNNLDEFASLSRSPVHFLNTRNNIDTAFRASKNPGLHFMVLSQSNMKKSLIDFGIESEVIDSGELVRANPTSEVLIVYFGLDLSYLFGIQNEFINLQLNTDFLIVRRLQQNLEIEEDLLRDYKSILIVNTSKSEISYAQKLAFEISRLHKVTYIKRIPSSNWGNVSEDLPEISPLDVVQLWKETKESKL